LISSLVNVASSLLIGLFSHGRVIFSVPFSTSQSLVSCTVRMPVSLS
jgi:hypothetical protein